MKPFALSAVLKYRKRLEETAAAELVEAQRDLEQKQKKLDETDRRYTALLELLANICSGGVTIEELLRYEHHLAWLKEEKSKLAAERDAAALKVKRKRSMVVGRSRDRKVLERLKAKQDKEYRYYLEKKQDAQLDELSVLSHDRKQQEV